MDSHSQCAAVDLRGDAAATSAGFSAFVETATVEFLSSLQLLAERARFLTGATGVAIALKEGSKYLYRASVGSSAASGAVADKRHAPLANCLATGKTSIVSAHSSKGQSACAVVPVVRQQEVAGFFELSAHRASFSNEDVLAVSGLAEMVNTALDHMQAAEDAHQRILEAGTPVKTTAVTPVTWHAAQQPKIPAKSNSQPSPVLGPLNVHACQSCGFPVSDGRKLCVECERNPNTVQAHEPALLAIEKEESWIGTHGYTIASVLVTALVAAIIFWLR